MKKFRKLAVILLICSSIAMGVFLTVDYLRQDNRPPVITVPDERIEVSIGVTEADLLLGVTARDDQAGDVADTLVVEDLSPIDENHDRVITYAAIDDQGNVGRAQRTMHYTDYEPPRFSMDRPLRREGSRRLSDMLEGITVSSSLDGDLTALIKYQRVDNAMPEAGAVIPVELRVTDSAENTVVLPVDVVMFDPREEAFQPKLTDYLVYCKVGEHFNPRPYYDRADNNPEAELQIESDVDTGIPGVYSVEYRVSNSRGIGATRLIVVVEE